MNRRALAAALVLVGGCSRSATPGERAGDAGARLEAAAVAAGLVADPASRSIVGSWARDTDRACIVPGAGSEGRIGVLVDYGAGLGCSGSGGVHRQREGLAVDLGAGCRFVGTFDGDRIAFPAVLPGACDRLCTGRATLAAFGIDRLSASPSEARSLRTPSGRPLCAD